MYIKFAELPVHDQDRAVEFYTTRLGMTVAQDSDYGSGWRWIELAMDGAQTKILLVKSESDSPPDTPTMAIVADDIDQLYDRLLCAETNIKQPPQTSPWDPAEQSMLFVDSEQNLILITSAPG